MATSLGNFTDTHIKVQKLRVATGNRITQLSKNDKSDPRSERIHELTAKLEELIESYISEDFTNHPTYPWVSRVKGCGQEAAAKVIGIIDGVTFKSTGRSGIAAFDNPSKLRRFAGLAPVDGKSEKLVKGEKGIHYNPELRMMLWRLLTSLMRAKGVWYQEYLKNDLYYMNRFEKEGIKVIPTPSSRLCPNCKEERIVPKTTFNCPVCGTKLVGKKEPPGVIFRGHVVAMAKRRTIRLWLDCLYLIWREAEGLPVVSPYILEHDGHHFIDPWKMVDK